MIELEDVRSARQRVMPYLKRTPLVRSDLLSQEFGSNVYLKLELFQRTGSFKPRGALNQIMQLDKESRNRGVVGVSGGNFAQGAAFAGNQLGVETVICMPAYTPANYIEGTKSYGARVELAPDIAAAFEKAHDFESQGYAGIHPYDNPAMIAGSGIIGLEIFEDLPEMTDLFISIGGGGSLAGNIISLKALNPKIRIRGIETEGSETMGEALKAGRVVQITPRSLARTLGAPNVSQDSLHLAQEHLEGYRVVSDLEAIRAQRWLLEKEKILVELAASCTLAAMRAVKREEAGRFGEYDHVVLLICGGNESLENMIRYTELEAETAKI